MDTKAAIKKEKKEACIKIAQHLDSAPRKPIRCIRYIRQFVIQSTVKWSLFSFLFFLASLLLFLILFLISNCWICLLILLWWETCHWVLLPVKVKLFKKKGKKIFLISFYSRREYRSRGAFSRCDAAPAVFRSLSRPNQQQHSLRFSGYDVTILSIREKLRASLFCKDKIIQVNFTRAQEIHVNVTVHQNVANYQRGMLPDLQRTLKGPSKLSHSGGAWAPPHLFRMPPRRGVLGMRRPWGGAIPVLESLCLSAGNAKEGSVGRGKCGHLCFAPQPWMKQMRRWGIPCQAKPIQATSLKVVRDTPWRCRRD